MKWANNNEIACTVSNLNKIIEWSSSRYNSMKKKEVISEIIFYVEKGEDTVQQYSSGCYSEKAHTRGKVKWTGGAYTLSISNGVNILSNGVEGVKNIQEFQIKLLRPKTFRFFIPAALVHYNISKYGIPEGYYRVIGQDVYSFDIMYDNCLRKIRKENCTWNL